MLLDSVLPTTNPTVGVSVTGVMGRVAATGAVTFFPGRTTVTTTAVVELYWPSEIVYVNRSVVPSLTQQPAGS